MQSNSHKFFANKDCEYYPCHPQLKEINCLFCYCPLYHIPDCGGNYVMLDNGCKDCSNCVLVHRPDGYEYVIEKLGGS